MPVLASLLRRARRRCSASSMVVAKKRAAAVHALFLVRVGRINLPRSHLDSWVRPAFNLLIFSIGLAPPRHPNALERSCWSARHDPRQAGVHISC